MCQPEVAVFLVFHSRDLVVRRLRAALAADALRGALLLADYGLQLQFAELHIGAQTEEAADAVNQVAVRGHRDITRLHQLDDLVLLAVVFQFQLLGIEIEGGIGVVVDVHVDLVAHLTRHAEVDFLVEVEAEGLPAVGSQRGVLHVLVGAADLQLCRALGLDLHAARSEDLLGRSQAELDVGEVELALAAGLERLLILQAVVVLHRTLQAPLLVFVGSHQDGGVQEPSLA